MARGYWRGPPADGKQRPRGIAALEDKIVQAAVVAILTPIYEAEFLGFSCERSLSEYDALFAQAGLRRVRNTPRGQWLCRHRNGRRVTTQAVTNSSPAAGPS